NSGLPDRSRPPRPAVMPADGSRHKSSGGWFMSIRLRRRPKTSGDTECDAIRCGLRVANLRLGQLDRPQAALLHPPFENNPLAVRRPDRIVDVAIVRREVGELLYLLRTPRYGID